MAGLDTNIILLIVAAVAMVVILAFALLRSRGGDDTTASEDAPPRAPLEPVKPQIDLATPMRFEVPVTEPVTVPAGDSGDRPAIAAAVGEPDDLRRIKGLGPKLAALLASLGITRFDQIAAWTDADIAEVDRFLGTFQGRIGRDNWVEQAGYLARGDEAGFAARFGSLGS